MIVQCGNCQTRFRVADERVTPRGLKVRCSRCGQVFVVRRAGDAAVVEPAPPHRVEAGAGAAAPERLDAGSPPAAPPPAPTTKVGAAAPVASVRPVLPPAAAAPEGPGLELQSFAGWEPPPSSRPFAAAGAPAPVPDLPGLPGLPWADPVRASPAIPAAAPSASPPEAALPSRTPTPDRRAAARPSPARRRERPPTGGPVAAAQVAIGAALLLALAFGAAAGLAAEVPGEGLAARAWHTLAGRDAVPPALVPEALRAGVRENADGARVLFVGGAVRSRHGNPAVPIVVVAEAVDRAGAVIARAQARAGRGATGSDGDDPPLATPLAPGETVPFLVVFDGVPAGIAGAGLRVTARLGEAAPEAPSPPEELSAASR